MEQEIKSPCNSGFANRSITELSEAKLAEIQLQPVILHRVK